MKRKVGLYLLFLLVTAVCLAQIKENGIANNNRKRLFIAFYIDNKTVNIDRRFKVFLINKQDTIRLKIVGHEVIFSDFPKDTGYSVVFKFKGYNLSFGKLYNKMIFPGQDMTWKFGVENRPFNDSLGLLKEDEYKTDKKTKQLQYLQLILMEYGDGIQFVNKIE